MNITVYLAASFSNDDSFQEAIVELGNWISESGNRLIYGGSKVGLMGLLADTVINKGGEVIGVEPQFFVDAVVQHEKLTKLIVTKDMSERKTKMIELADAFIAFPGGTGTLEELSEVLSKISLKQLEAPCIIYNLNGYYDHLKALLNHMIELGLSSKDKLKDVYFVNDLSQIKEILNHSSSRINASPYFL